MKVLDIEFQSGRQLHIEINWMTLLGLWRELIFFTKRLLGSKSRFCLIRFLVGWKGDASLCKLAQKIPYLGNSKDTNFVIVSSANVPFVGAETYIFPADRFGKVLNWGELPGSYRGGLAHQKALDGLVDNFSQYIKQIEK